MLFWGKRALIVPTVKGGFPGVSPEISESAKEEEQEEKQLLVSEHNQELDRHRAEVAERSKTMPEALSELPNCVRDPEVIGDPSGSAMPERVHRCVIQR